MSNIYTLAKTLVKHYYINVLAYLNSLDLLDHSKGYDNHYIIKTLYLHLNSTKHNHMSISKEIINLDMEY